MTMRPAYEILEVLGPGRFRVLVRSGSLADQSLVWLQGGTALLVDSISVLTSKGSEKAAGPGHECEITLSEALAEDNPAPVLAVGDTLRDFR